jgi:hypothetical protein
MGVRPAKLISDFWALKLYRNKLLSKPPDLWSFVTGATEADTEAQHKWPM